MDTNRPNSIVQVVMALGLIAAGLWVVIPLLDVLRVGLGSPVFGRYVSEAFGRAIVGLLALWAVGRVLGAISRPKRARP